MLPNTVISRLVEKLLIPASGAFEITEDVLYAYFLTYRQLSAGNSVGSRSNAKFARRLAGLNLLKENISRGTKSGTIKAGHIYLISNPAFKEYYKIGVSYDCHTRLAQYQTYSPHRDFKLEKYDFVLDKYATEKILLNHPLLDRSNGEWIFTQNAKIIFDDLSKVHTDQYKELW